LRAAPPHRSLREIARYLGWRLAEEIQWRELASSARHPLSIGSRRRPQTRS